MNEPKQSPLKDDRLNDPNAHIEVVFDGSITLWRSGTNLDVIVVYFELLNCMELIVFNPIRNVEANRIYIDFRILEKHLPRAEMQARIDERKELFLRRHRTYVATEIEKEVELNIMSAYIVSRIAIKDSVEFEVELQPHFGDTVKDDEIIEKGTVIQHLDFIMHKPEALSPIHTEHFAKPSYEIFQKTLLDIEADTKAIHQNFADANKLLRVVELAAIAFQDNKLRNTNPNLTRACIRWKKAINRVINIILCEKFKKYFHDKEVASLTKKALETDNTKPDFVFDSNVYLKGLGPLNAAGILPYQHRSKFENHLHKSRDQRHDEMNHPAIHILQKNDSRRPSLVADSLIDEDHSLFTARSTLMTASVPELAGSHHHALYAPPIVSRAPNSGTDLLLRTGQHELHNRKPSLTAGAHLPSLDQHASSVHHSNPSSEKGSHNAMHHLFPVADSTDLAHHSTRSPAVLKPLDHSGLKHLPLHQQQQLPQQNQSEAPKSHRSITSDSLGYDLPKVPH